MPKPRARKDNVSPENGRLLVEVKVTMAVKATNLEQADELIEGLMNALRAGDFEELKRLHGTVAPGSWRSWAEYDIQ
jgi:hypothetical protein